ncbi:hypothetical protein OIU34_20295 [Pararhizobium sp. BT-229]|uniref:hypothetical protein n=1 Tax=Pararhizobium sp. BT-229 TaxID=2986923 RepID=UPI0021F6F8F1|nr:hypothetical protein [Pararhizobium sp. BT-229]MCV9964229.1 hypothetical protein [Pararhizobium sp. BT-229]
MRVRIPFVYRVDGVNAAGFDVEGEWGLESFAFDIPEVNNEDWPIALFYLEGPPSRRLPHVVRTGSGGSFYRSAPWNAGHGDIKKSVGASYLSPSPNNGSAAYDAYFVERGMDPKSLEAGRLRSWYSHGASRETAPLSAFKEVHQTDRHLRLIEAQEFADRMVAIDGELAFRCEEPKIVVSLDSNMAPAFILGWSGSTRYGTVINEKFGIKVGSPAQTRFFRADDIDGALAFVAGRGITNEMEYGKEFICRLPQLFTFDPVADFAERSAEAIVQETAPIVGLMEENAVQSWLSLRDGRRSMEPDAIMEHVRILTPQVRNETTRLAMREILVEWEHLEGTAASANAVLGPRP